MMFVPSMESCFLQIWNMYTFNTVHESSSAGQFARRQACESSFMYMFMLYPSPPKGFRTFPKRLLSEAATAVTRRATPFGSESFALLSLFPLARLAEKGRDGGAQNLPVVGVKHE